MILKDIQDLWVIDSKIDRYNLIEESLKAPLLHSKYYEIYMIEKRLLVEQQEKFKNLELAKSIYYQGKMGESELKQRNWKQFGLQIPKTDVPKVVDADEDIITYKIKISEQFEKAKFVESILQSIHQRSFNIKNAIDYERFQAGI